MKNKAWLWRLFSSNRQISDVGVNTMGVVNSNYGKYSNIDVSGPISSIGCEYDVDAYFSRIMRVSELGNERTIEATTMPHLLGRVG